MKRLAASAMLSAVVLACCAMLVGQSAPPVAPQEVSPAASGDALQVPEGESLALELRDPLNTKTTRKGDVALLKTTQEVIVDGRVAIPKDTTIRAEVVEAKRPGRLFGRAKIKLEFREVIFSDGTSLPLTANLTRAGWWDPSGKGERGRGYDVARVGQGAAEGALLGAILGGKRSAARGAAAGTAISAIAVLLERGPDLDLPSGMMFEIELAKPLQIPLKVVDRVQMASREPSSAVSEASESEPPSNAAGESVATSAPPTPAAEVEGSPAASAASATPPKFDSPVAGDDVVRREGSPAEGTTVAANRTPPAMPPAAPPAPVDPALTAGAYKLKVDVNLVLVEATVRDDRGAIVSNLKPEDFRVFEDGVEQQIQHFSRDEFPLAVALVVDRSGSVAPVLQELRRAAYETLTLLKPDDRVALFSFAASPERVEALTTDRDRIADAIASIHAGGGTNITDALFDAVVYLGRAAPTRRHALILVSDNQGTVRGYARDQDVIRMALETETVIYSIKVSSPESGGVFNLPGLVPLTGSVKKMARETGGEVIDADRSGSVGSAMAVIINRLKQRYTLGYPSSNKEQDGRFRKIDVKLSDRLAGQRGRYTVYARRGYYPRLDRLAGRAPSR